MPKDGFKKISRTVFVTVNKFQRDIILLVFLPSVFIILSFNAIVFLGNPGFFNAIFHTSFLIVRDSADQISVSIVIVMCLFFLLSLVGAFIISHKMVGAFGRITRELDDVIAGRSQKKINCRPDDVICPDILKRINVLVEAYVKQKK